MTGVMWGYSTPRGHELQGERLAVDDQAVAGVVAALVAHDVVAFFGQQVGELALAFVAPLRADDHCCGHVGCLPIRSDRAGRS